MTLTQRSIKTPRADGATLAAAFTVSTDAHGGTVCLECGDHVACGKYHECWRLPMIEGNPTNTPSPDEDRELIERVREIGRWLRDVDEPTAADSADEAADRIESLLSDRAKLEEALRGIQDRIEAAAGWINDATRWDEEDSPDGVGTITDHVLKDVRAVLNRSTDRG